MLKQASLAAVMLLTAAAASPVPADAADVNVGGGAGLTIGVGAPDWTAAPSRARDQAQRYTQFVQMSTQLMGELQNTERELTDALQTMKRQADEMMESYSTMRDADFRMTERLMTAR